MSLTYFATISGVFVLLSPILPWKTMVQIVRCTYFEASRVSGVHGVDDEGIECLFDTPTRYDAGYPLG